MSKGSRVQTEPDEPNPKDTSETGHGPNGSKLTIWSPSQFLACQDDPQDILLSNGYLEKGSPCVVCGPPGIGKSRLVLQLAIQSILGQGFLGWNTNAFGLIWLILQNENGNRRIKGDYAAMLKDLTSKQRQMLDESLFMHALVSDTDGDLNLADLDNRKRVIEAVGDYKPDVVVGDPLTSLSNADLNNDQAMLAVARDFGCVARTNNVKAVPLLLQHARTGREAQRGMSGSERSNFARNSKALYGWTRSQFNMSPVEEKTNDRLYFASGKCNNAPEFEEFIIQLDPETRFYAKTTENADEIRQARREENGTAGASVKKFHPEDLKPMMSTTVSRRQCDVMRQMCNNRNGPSLRTFKNLWKDAKELGLIEHEADDKYVWKS
jgi:RecA-family ATPase